MHCSGVTSDNGPAVTSRNCVLDPRKNVTLDVTSKMGGERRSMTNCELAEEDNGNRDVGGNLVLGEGDPLFSGQICGSLE